jgi:hypothetical protein
MEGGREGVSEFIIEKSSKTGRLSKIFLNRYTMMF